MPRCNCGAGTCACSVTPGVGISVSGNGSTAAPYEITNTQGSLGQQLIVSDTETVDLALSPSNPQNLTGAWVLSANASMALTDLTDVRPDQVLEPGDVPVWRDDHWEFEQGAGGGLPSDGEAGQVLTRTEGISAQNLIWNPRFMGTPLDTLPGAAKWTVQRGTLVADSTVKRHITGPQSGKVTVTVTDGAVYIGPGSTTGDRLPITAGQLLTVLFSVFPDANAGRTYRSSVYYYDVGGTLITGSPVSAESVDCPASEWTDIRDTYPAAPAGAASFRIIIGTEGLIPVAGANFWLCEPQATTGAYADPYFDGTSPDEDEHTFAWSGTADASPSNRTTLSSAWEDVDGLPPGGTDGQALLKQSSTDGDANWETLPPSLPPGGTDGQVLTKQSSTNGDALWEAVPAGGGGGGPVVLEPSIIAAYYRLAPMTGIGATSTPILWDTADTVAEGITYTQATGTFMVLTSGWYLITTRVRVTAASATPYQLRLINTSTGGFIDFMADSAGPGTQAGSLSKQVYLAAGTGFQVHLSGSTVPVDLSVTGNRANAVEVSRLDRGVVGSSAPGKTVLEPTYAAARNNASAQSIPNGGSPTIITFDTENYTEGIPWVSGNQFTIPVDGYYQVDTGITFGTNVTGARVVYIYLNSGPVTQAFFAQSSRESSAVASTTIKAKAGDYITVRAYQNSGVALTLTTAATQNWVTVAKVPSLAPGGGGVVVERPILGIYQRATAMSATNTAGTIVVWDTVEEAADGIGYNSGVFTCQTAGLYIITARMRFTFSGTLSAATYNQIRINKNGGIWDFESFPYVPSSTSSHYLHISRQMKLVPGDTITLSIVPGGTTVTVDLATSANHTNSVEISKVPAAYAGSAVSTYGERNYSALRRQAAAVSVPTVTQVTMPWDTVESDNGIPFAAGIFTIPVAGYYEINCTVNYVPNATGYRQIRVQVNGSTAQTTSFIAAQATYGTTVVYSKTHLFAAGDTVSVTVQQNSGATITTDPTPATNWINITKVPAPVVNGAAASGVWGVGPLDSTKYGVTSDLLGREVYIDSKGQLRANSGLIQSTPAAKTPASLPAEYPLGTSVLTVGSADASNYGWPPLTSCTVVTHVRPDAVMAGQWCYLNSTTVSRAWYRNGQAGGWAPWAEMTSGQGTWTDCALEVRFCTDSSTVANVGQQIQYARYMKIGKTVWYAGRGIIGSGAVVNFALLLPPSAGVPATFAGVGQTGPPQATTSNTEAILGGYIIGGAPPDRIINYVGASTAFSDSVANQNYRWNFNYEVT